MEEGVLMKYWVCTTCGRLTPAVSGFCTYCKAPLPSFMNSPDQNNNGIFLARANVTLVEQGMIVKILIVVLMKYLAMLEPQVITNVHNKEG
jgi:hypothetical protein